MSFKAPFKLMLFDSYNDPVRLKAIVTRIEHALCDFADHRRGEAYLLIDVSPLRQVWHFAVHWHGADNQLRLEKLELASQEQSATASDGGTQDVEQVFQEFQVGIAERIKALRLERGLSLRDMVVKHGYHDSSYRRMEREGVGNVKSLLQLAHAFDVPLQTLIDGLGYQPPRP